MSALGERLLKSIGLRIGGAEAAASDGRTFERVNPITGSIASVAAAASQDDAIRAADAAASAFPAWSATAPKARRAILLDAADRLRASADAFVEAMGLEIGATEAWARFNVMLASDMLVEAAALTTQINGEIIPSNRPGSLAMAVRQPAGVVLGMAPWNAPVILGVRAIATPLACGNTVVMKTSEICPRTHQLIADAVLGALEAAGQPQGVVNVVSNAPEDAASIVETLIAHPAIRRVNFTGSTRVGRIIAETAGRHLKPALLELGGKAPLIVLEDADIERAVAAASFGAYMNQGQICMSTERIIVEEAVADRFVEALAAKVRTYRASDPREGQTALGSLVDEGAAVRVYALVQDALDKGAVALVGGEAPVGPIMQPVLLDRINSSMKLYLDESFGPVASVIRVNSADEAIRVANESSYGLSAAVFSENITRAMAVAKRIESGICHINGPTVHDEAQMPFGGVKDSGYGRFGGMAGVAEFTELRWITIQEGTPHYPI